jgi:hypothetical protein
MCISSKFYMIGLRFLWQYLKFRVGLTVLFPWQNTCPIISNMAANTFTQQWKCEKHVHVWYSAPSFQKMQSTDQNCWTMAKNWMWICALLCALNVSVSISWWRPKPELVITMAWNMIRMWYQRQICIYSVQSLESHSYHFPNRSYDHFRLRTRSWI